MIDYGTGIAFEISSIKFNPNLMGAKLKATERLFLGYIWIKYTSTDAFTLTLNYRRGTSDADIETLSYTVPADENYFLQKLPPNIAVTEFWLTASGTSTVYFQTPSFGVLWAALKVGMGG